MPRSHRRYSSSTIRYTRILLVAFPRSVSNQFHNTWHLQPYNSEAEVEDVEGLRVVEDTQLMRIQLIFDGKPEPEIRSILKGNGFRWAPSQGAWQRQLNSNGQRAARRAIEEIRKIQTQEVGA